MQVLAQHSRLVPTSRPSNHQHTLRPQLNSTSTRLHAISRLDEVASHPNSTYQASASAAAVLADAARQHASTATQPPRCDQALTLTPDTAPTTAAVAAAGQRHIHAAFGAFFCYLGLMAAAATSPDWYLDVAAFGGLWGLLWAACARLQTSANTVVLLCLLPVLHLSGARGMYHWELGNLSWDVLVHISNGFIGTLLFATVLADLAAASSAAVAAGQPGAVGLTHSHSSSSGESGSSGGGARQGVWRERAWGVLKVTALLLLSTSLIEVVEAAGGQVAGHAGEGIFLRGPGDLCTASLPCSEEVDTAKDMVDNCAGMMLALLALATRGVGGGRSSGANSPHA